MKSIVRSLIMAVVVFGFISFKTIFAAAYFLAPKKSSRAIPVGQNVDMSERSTEQPVERPSLSGSTALPFANPLHDQQGIGAVDLGTDDRETLGKPVGVFEVIISNDGSIQLAGTDIDALGESVRDLLVPFIKRDCKISPLLPIGQDADATLIATTNGQSVEECAHQVVQKVSANLDEIASLRHALTETRRFIHSHTEEKQKMLHKKLEQKCLVPFGKNELNVQECTECIKNIDQPMRPAQ